MMSCNSCTLAPRPAFWSRFTSKERDAETGLDYFRARYYSGAQGRFMTPDWSGNPEPIPYADLGNPQSLNLYAYVRNNPVVTSDSDGHTIDDEDLANCDEYQKWKRSYFKQKGAKDQWDTLDKSYGCCGNGKVVGDKHEMFFYIRRVEADAPEWRRKVLACVNTG
jgi:RHS repeat-associated protein